MKLAPCALAALLAAGPALAQTLNENVGAAPPGFSDNSVSYRYGWQFREPGVTNSAHANGIDIPKHILTFTHVDGGTMWSNFINIDALFSTSRDPAKGGPDAAGAIEVYGLYRGDLSLNQATRSNWFTVGRVLQDVSFQIGGDFNTKNTDFAPAKKLLVFGPDFHWNVPVGFLSTAIEFSKEWNNNGIVGKSVDFAPAIEFEGVWSFPVPVAALPISFEGFANVVGPKGRDGFGAGTKTEVLTEPRISLDLGAVAFDKPRRLDAFVGYQYWLNKFGNDNTKVPGSLANAWFFGVRYHL